MRILHTSDWHLGASLYDHSRQEEHRRFLEWLAGLVRDEGIDALLVSGDIFDTALPPNAAVELYYDFFSSLRGSPCRSVVVTGGNHDSPSHLDAPSLYLRHNGIHVLGCARKNPEEEVVVLPAGEDGTPGCVVCAVPFLRDRDVRTGTTARDQAERNRQMQEGIRDHYARVAAIAMERARAQAPAGFGRLPVIAMGHLFVRSAARGDGESDIVVGTLGEVDMDIFPDGIDYAALGHLHTPQKVGGRENVRYCGSPLPMTFGEHGKKQVLVVECTASPLGTEPGDRPLCTVQRREIPVFRELVSLSGDETQLEQAIRTTAVDHPGAYVEAEDTGTAPGTGLRRRLCEVAKEACPDGAQPLEILRVKRVGRISALARQETGKSLDELTEKEVFERLLARQHDMGEAEKAGLRDLFDEILLGIGQRPEDRDGSNDTATPSGER